MRAQPALPGGAEAHALAPAAAHAPVPAGLHRSARAPARPPGASNPRDEALPAGHHHGRSLRNALLRPGVDVCLDEVAVTVRAIEVEEGRSGGLQAREVEAAGVSVLIVGERVEPASDQVRVGDGLRQLVGQNANHALHLWLAVGREASAVRGGRGGKSQGSGESEYQTRRAGAVAVTHVQQTFNDTHTRVPQWV